ncbi:MerR family transcriptional regulator [Streptomyces europaeiscabiei]|uniref:hypothetical protein n=1 Tax=Streptomyces europaeiscabiei TaxID=146819 RepID=UPI0038F66FDF
MSHAHRSPYPQRNRRLLRLSVQPAEGQRQYPDGAVARVRAIQQLYAAGLASRLVREVLPRCMNEGPSPVGFTDSLITERARIDRQITDLTAVRIRLDEIIAVATDPSHPHHSHPVRGGAAARTASVTDAIVASVGAPRAKRRPPGCAASPRPSPSGTGRRRLLSRRGRKPSLLQRC